MPCAAIDSPDLAARPALRCQQGDIAIMQRAIVGAQTRLVQMSRNALYLVIGLLAAGVIVTGYLYFEESRTPTGIEIEIGEHGITIEEK